MRRLHCGGGAANAGRGAHRRALAATAALAAAACAALAGCAAPQPPLPASVAALMQQPAEHALAAGLLDYDAGQFEAARRAFQSAIDQGLHSAHDAAVAHKFLAFIDCAFNRLAECDTHFRAAFAADPGFRLNEAEIGHPIWGPVYRSVAAQLAPAAPPGGPASAPAPTAAPAAAPTAAP